MTKFCVGRMFVGLNTAQVLSEHKSFAAATRRLDKLPAALAGECLVLVKRDGTGWHSAMPAPAEAKPAGA